MNQRETIDNLECVEGYLKAAKINIMAGRQRVARMFLNDAAMLCQEIRGSLEDTKEEAHAR